jgi:hypothetical protein
LCCCSSLSPQLLALEYACVAPLHRTDPGSIPYSITICPNLSLLLYPCSPSVLPPISCQLPAPLSQDLSKCSVGRVSKQYACAIRSPPSVHPLPGSGSHLSYISIELHVLLSFFDMPLPLSSCQVLPPLPQDPSKATIPKAF